MRRIRVALQMAGMNFGTRSSMMRPGMTKGAYWSSPISALLHHIYLYMLHGQHHFRRKHAFLRLAVQISAVFCHDIIDPQQPETVISLLVREKTPPRAAAPRIVRYIVSTSS